MNSAHNGCHLGTALYKTCNWLGIAHKIGWVTCDNVSNNTLMMMCFAAIVQQATGKEFNAVKQQIRWVSCHYFFIMSGSLITKVSCAHYQPCNAGYDIKILRVKVLWPRRARWWPHVPDCVSLRWGWTNSNYHGQGMLLCNFLVVQ